MCRLRIHNGILTHWQFAGMADLAEKYAGGYSHVTTRANLQLREIPARHGIDLIESIIDPGALLEGIGFRQYPQRHRRCDRRHRAA